MPSRLVYIGTYTDPSPQAGRAVTPDAPVMGMTGPTGSEGIYVLQQDTATGALTPLHAVGGAVNPSFLALDPQERFLFAACETRAWAGGATGTVASFALAPAGGPPRLLGEMSSEGQNPCHLTVSPDGRWLLVANYEDARVAVLPIGDDGRLGAATAVREDAPLQDGSGRRSHAHFVAHDPAGRFVLSTNVGTDRITVETLDTATGRLLPHDPLWGETHPGGGARHLAFSPDGRAVYANGEGDLTLSVFDYDAERGALTPRQHLSTLPPGTTGERFSTSQIAAHPNGRAVYVANRGHDTIAIFRIDPATGAATLIANEPTRGLTPRNFALDPEGRFLYVANQNSGTIVPFAVDPETGLLTATGDETRVPEPTCILFAGHGGIV